MWESDQYSRKDLARMDKAPSSWQPTEKQAVEGGMVEGRLGTADVIHQLRSNTSNSLETLRHFGSSWEQLKHHPAFCTKNPVRTGGSQFL